MIRNVSDYKLIGLAVVMCPAVQAASMLRKVRTVRGDLWSIGTGNRAVHGRENLGSGVI